ncbi:hypothetical protein [Amycolatopsis sp. NPDC004079]|uniref:hypothetical protein n=1 Tax=Amycolatopsis sp. NPDC004079 TaxID=3154549 RepID=UPI0033A950D1
MHHRHPPDPPDDHPRTDDRRKHPKNPGEHRDNRPMPRSHPPSPITPPPSPNPHPPRPIQRRPDQHGGSLLGSSRSRGGFAVFARYFSPRHRLIDAASTDCRADGFSISATLTDPVAASCIAASSGPAVSHSDNRAIADPTASNSPLDGPVADRIGNPAVSTGLVTRTGLATRSDPVTDGIGPKLTDRLVARAGLPDRPTLSAELTARRIARAGLPDRPTLSAELTARRIARAGLPDRRVASYFIASTQLTTGAPLTRSVHHRLDPAVRTRRRFSTHRPPRSAWHPHFPPLPGAPGGAPRLACSV